MTPELDTRLNAQELARQLAEKRVSVFDLRETIEFGAVILKPASMCRGSTQPDPAALEPAFDLLAAATLTIARLGLLIR